MKADWQEMELKHDCNPFGDGMYLDGWFTDTDTGNSVWVKVNLSDKRKFTIEVTDSEANEDVTVDEATRAAYAAEVEGERARIDSAIYDALSRRL